MGNFKIVKTKIEDLLIIESTSYSDQRGFFMESYNEKTFFELGIKEKFVQDNHSKSTKGVLRGMHYQEKNAQSKLIRVIKGKIYDVAIDLREESSTYKKWVGVVLSDENRLQFFIPKGFAHGFLVLSDQAECVYKCSDFYDSTDERGILWNDPEINIQWPLEGIESIILSEKDKQW